MQQELLPRVHAPRQLQRVVLPESEVLLQPRWLDAHDATAAMQALCEELPWAQHRIRLFGREVLTPRLCAWVGDAQASYAYSGTRFEPLPWTATLLGLRERLQREGIGRFNSVLANRYRDGHDSMGCHADDEPELGVEPVIASISLGATRRFRLRHRCNPGLRAELLLEHGSLLLMRGATQSNYLHDLPKTARPVGERINLTFRLVGNSASAAGNSRPSAGQGESVG
jgi:alkylated DNA repair dioxygenase AlkB